MISCEIGRLPVSLHSIIYEEVRERLREPLNKSNIKNEKKKNNQEISARQHTEQKQAYNKDAFKFKWKERTIQWPSCAETHLCKYDYGKINMNYNNDCGSLMI